MKYLTHRLTAVMSSYEAMLPGMMSALEGLSGRCMRRLSGSLQVTALPDGSN
jgi:hypothetical protein